MSCVFETLHFVFELSSDLFRRRNGRPEIRHFEAVINYNISTIELAREICNKKEEK